MLHSYMVEKQDYELVSVLESCFTTLPKNTLRRVTLCLVLLRACHLIIHLQHDSSLHHGGSYSNVLQPWNDILETHDALQLEILCGDAPPPSSTKSAITVPLQGVRAFVAPEGSDDAAGTAEAPFASVQRALQHVRQVGGEAEHCS